MKSQAHTHVTRETTLRRARIRCSYLLRVLHAASLTDAHLVQCLWCVRCTPDCTVRVVAEPVPTRLESFRTHAREGSTFPTGVLRYRQTVSQKVSVMHKPHGSRENAMVLCGVHAHVRRSSGPWAHCGTCSHQDRLVNSAVGNLTAHVLGAVTRALPPASCDTSAGASSVVEMRSVADAANQASSAVSAVSMALHGALVRRRTGRRPWPSPTPQPLPWQAHRTERTFWVSGSVFVTP